MYSTTTSVRNSFDGGCNTRASNAGGGFIGHIKFGTSDLYGELIKNVEITGEWPTADGSYTIGNIISHSIKADIQTSDVIENVEVEFSIDVVLDSETVNIPIGIFIIDTVEVNEDIVSISGTDRLQKASQYNYVSTLAYPATLQAIAVEICTQCGLTLDTSFSFPTFNIDEAIADKSCWDALSIVAELVAGNVYMSRKGEVLFRILEHHESSVITPDMHYEFTRNQNSFPLESVVCTTSNKTFTSGSGKGIAISNDYMTQDRLDMVLANVRMTYYGAYCKFIGDPTLDISDVITIQDKARNNYTVPIMYNKLTFDGGITNEIYSYAESDTQVEKTRQSITQKFASLEKSLDGFIFTVGATYITGEQLESELDILAGKIDLKVSKTDFTGEQLVSMINLSPESILLSSGKIDMQGYVTVTDLVGEETIINGNLIRTGKIVSDNFYQTDNEGNYIIDESGNHIESGLGFCIDIENGFIYNAGEYDYTPMGGDTYSQNARVYMDKGRLTIDNMEMGANKEIAYYGYEGISTNPDPNESRAGVDLKSTIFKSLSGNYYGTTVYSKDSPTAIMSKGNACIDAPQWEDYDQNPNQCVFSHHIKSGKGCIDYGVRTANSLETEFEYYGGITIDENGDIYASKGGNGNKTSLSNVYADNIPNPISNIEITSDDSGKATSVEIEDISGNTVTCRCEYNSSGKITKFGDISITYS